MPSSRFAAAAALLLLAGCSRDLSLPDDQAPVIRAVAPAEAYAGEVLTIQGDRFEADPASNLVVFARASARAFAVAGDALLVRVPTGAGSGPLSVTTGAGTSAAFEGFGYRGGGQLATGEVVSTTPLLHTPRGLISLGGRLYVDSTLAGGLVRLDDPGFFLVGGGRQRPTAGGGALFTIDVLGESGASTNKYLRRFDAATETVSQRLVPQDRWDNIGYVQRAGGDRLIGLGPDPADLDHLAVFQVDPVTLLDLGDPDPIPAAVTGSLRDTGAGVLAFAALPETTDPPVLALLNLSGAVPAYTTVASAGRGLDRNTIALGVGTGPRGPGFDGTVRRLAAVGLSNGDVAIADLDAATPAYVGADVDTRSTSAVDSLLFVGGNLLVITKPDENAVLGVSLATRQVLWAVAGQQPSVMALHDGLLWVAQKVDSALLVIDPATGRQVNSVRVRVRPGTDDGYAGLSFRPGDEDPFFAQYLADTPYMVLGVPQRLLGYSLGLVRPIVATATELPSFTATSPDHVVWTGTADALEVPNTTPADVYPLLGRPRRVAFDDAWLLVGHDAGVSLVESGVLGGEIHAGAAFDEPVLDGVGFLPSGSPYAILQFLDTESGLRRWGLAGWTVEALQAGGPMFGLWLDRGDGSDEYCTSVLLEDGLWIFWVSDSGSSWAFRVDPAWAGSGLLDLDAFLWVPFAPYLPNFFRQVALEGGQPAPPIVSPNRRTFVHWEDNLYGGTDLHVRSADPATTFEELAFAHLAGTVSGAVFDDRGERLFVITREPDALLELR